MKIITVGTELEIVVMDWMAKALNLPEKFQHGLGGLGGGVISTTASEATLVAILAAKERVIYDYKQSHKTNEKDGEISRKLVAYVSDQAHFSLLKDFKVLGFENIRTVPVNQVDFTLSPSSLEKLISDDVDAGLLPCFVCATFGTTSTTAIDPIEDISNVIKSSRAKNIWLHVDGAYGGAWLMVENFSVY